MVQTIELTEYGSTRLRAPDPTSADRELAQRLSPYGDLEPRLVVRWLAGGEVEVVASSWVGVVRFSSLEIRIVPKLVGDALRVLRMIEYTSGVRLIAHLPMDRQLPADGTDLFELVVMLLIEETKLLIRDGLIRDYRPVDDALDVMRGRLRLREQYLRRYGSFHRLECHFDEYDGDVPENQFLAAAFTAASPRLKDYGVQNSARAMANLLAGICLPGPREPDWYERKIVYGRRNARYRSAHELAKLVLQGLALTDLFDTSSGRITAFMLDMNVVFERFVTRLVENSLAGSTLRVARQATFSNVIVNDGTGRSYSAIRPDLLIVDTQTDERVPVDIKYKLYDARKFGSDDIYQLFFYARVLGGESASPAAGLIYPSIRAIAGPALRVQPLEGSTRTHIRGAGLDIPSILDSVLGSGPDAGSAHTAILDMVCNITGFGAGLPTSS
jgi:5-methylcytosine-specific restriction enzyme subunit McrC